RVDLGLGRKVLCQRHGTGAQPCVGTALILGQVRKWEQAQDRTQHLIEDDPFLRPRLRPAQRAVEGPCARQIGNPERDQRYPLRCHFSFLSVTSDSPPASATSNACARDASASNNSAPVPVMKACAPSAQISS